MDLRNLSNLTNTSHISSIVMATRTDVTYFLVWMIGMSLMGTIGNISILLCYPRNANNGLHSSTFVFVLAILDLVASVIVIPYSILFEFNMVTNDVLCKLCEFIRHLTITTSLLVLLSIAIQRFLVITMEARNMKKHFALRLISVAFVVGFVISLPSLFVYKVTDVDVKRVSLVEPHSSCNPLIDLYVMKVFVYIIFILFVVITLSLVILYGIIYTTVLRYLYRCRLVTPIQMASRKKDGCNSGNLTVFVKNTENTIPKQALERQLTKAKLQEGTSKQVNISNSVKNGQKASIEFTKRTRVCAQNSEEVSKKPKQNEDSSATERRTFQAASTATTNQSLLEHKLFISQIQGATMLFGVTVIFVITWIPFWLTKLMVIVYYPVLHYLFFFNHATNIFVYLFYSKQFRKNISRSCRRRYY